MADKNRPVLDDEELKRCYDAIDKLVKLYNETHPDNGDESTKDKDLKAQEAIIQLGRIGGILTQWAEHHIFGVYYNVAKSENQYLNEEECNKHEHELMWYQDYPDDLFSDDHHLACERAAIADILRLSFSLYGRMGWRMSMNECLYALNEGQVEWLLEPINTKQHGNAYDIQKLKYAAIKHIYRLMGDGWKKMAAQQNLAEACSVTHEAIKKWEREFKNLPEYDIETLITIAGASKFMSDFPEAPYSEMIKQAVIWELNEDEDKSLRRLGRGIILIDRLNFEYPIESLAERLAKAEFRSK